RKTTRSSPSRRWCASSPTRCARSSATFPTPSARWSACSSGSNSGEAMNQAIDSRQLENEIESLRQQLHEAEQLREAISHGHVDAFVVGPTDDSKRILLLSGAYARYRQLVEEMQQGAVTVNRSGEIMFANQAFASMLGLAPIDIFRVPLTRYIVGADASEA